MTYTEFLEKKQHSASNYGIEPNKQALINLREVNNIAIEEPTLF